MGSRIINGWPFRETVVFPLPGPVSKLAGASATAVVPAHRPRRPTGRAAESAASEPSHAAPSPAACSLTSEVRVPGPVATTRGERADSSRSSPGSARHETTASAPTCSCSPSGIWCSIPFRVELRRDLLNRLALLTHLDDAIHQLTVTAQRFVARDRANDLVAGRDTTPPRDHHSPHSVPHGHGPRHAPPPSG